MIGKTNSQTGGALRGEKLNISLTSNQSSHSDLIGAVITITHAGGTTEHVWGGSEFTVEVPPYVEYSVEYGKVEGYATPAKFTATAVKDNARTLTAEYKTTIVTVNMADNQSSLDDIANATATIVASGITTKTVKTGQSVKVPTGVSCTVTWGALADYKTPSAQTFTTSGTAVAKTGTYQTELVSVTLNADNGASVNGAKVTINGKSHAWNGTAITQKVAFGTTYSVSVGALDGFSTPSAQNNISASQASRSLTFTYIASALKVNILSNQSTENSWDPTITNIKAIVKYGSTTLEVSNGQQINLPSGTSGTIEFPEVEGYKKPETISFTHNGGLTEKSGTYQCELLTVNVSADSGTPTGFEVTISKQETVGIATKYVKLDYIEANGNQYADTGLVVNKSDNYKMEVNAFFTNDTYGGCNGYMQFKSGIALNKKSTIRVEYNSNIEKIYVDGVLNTTDDWTTRYSETNVKLGIFKLGDANNSWYDGEAQRGQLYSCKIYKNNSLIRDYIPALRSDGITGLYDSVNDTFTASSGSGNFIAGGEHKETIATQTSVTGSYKIPFDTSYSVQANKISGYDMPQSVTRVASAKSYTVSQQYTVITVRDLSLMDIYGNPIARSTANCYVVREAGQYKFPCVYGNAIKNGKVNTAAFTNNGGSNSHDFVSPGGYVITSPYIDASKTRGALIHNKDAENVVSGVSLIAGDDCEYVQFTVNSIPTTGANVILCVHSEIPMWSWHIWLWPHDLTPVEITNSTGVKYNIMPFNLASKYDSDGVHIKNWFYQWGRPNPMLLPSAWNSTTDHIPGSITKASEASDLQTGLANPSTFYCRSSSSNNWFGTKSYYNLWDAACTGTGNSDNDTVKTVYDPCPVGWKVPNGNTFTGLSILSNANGIVKMKRYSGDTVGVGFPMSGYRSESDGSLGRVGSGGYVWLSSADSQYVAYYLELASSYVLPQNNNHRANGFSVRPVQDDLTKIDSI